MKLTIVLVFAIIVQVSATAFAQTVTLRQREITLKQLFKVISQQTGYDILYQPDKVNESLQVSADFNQTPVKEVLEKALDNFPYEFTINEKTIIVKEKKSQQKSASNPAFPVISPPGNTITGTVVDTTGKPVTSVTVSLSTIEKNKATTTFTQKRTSTDSKGGFIISDVLPGDYSLLITSIGYKPVVKTIKVNNEGTLALGDIVLREVSTSLNEVSISTGYQRIKPTQSTGATASIGTKEYESQISTDLLSGLVNKLPGLVINNDVKFTTTNNGITTSNSLFNIRGLSTITGNQNPLIVLDGYPTELSLSDINPNEIKSVTILKDAAAAAIYGVRASNGVIVIERKQATIGNTQFAFRSTVSMTPTENYSGYRWAPNGYMNYYRTYYQDGNNPVIAGQYNSYASLGLSGFNPASNIWYARASGLLTQDQATSQLNALAAYDNSTDYSRLFTRTAIAQQYNLDASGGSDKALYYFTVNYLGNRLNQDNNGNQQLQLTGRTTFKFTKRFSLELTTEYLNRTANSAPVPDINQFYPFERFQDAAGQPLSTFTGSAYTTSYIQSYMAKGYYDNDYYPLVDLNQISTNTHTVDNRITGNFRYVLGNGINLTWGGIYESSSTDQRYYATDQSSVVHQIVNLYADQSTNPVTFNVPKGGYLEQTGSQLKSYTARVQLDYNKQIGKDNSLNAIGGAEVRGDINQSNAGAYFGYNDQSLLSQPVDFNKILLNPPASAFGINSPLQYNSLFNQTYTEDRYVSFYGNAVYAYKGKYSLTGSLRVDQSNLFGTDPKYRYKPLWSIGAAWNIDREKFMQSVDWVNALKLRLAYGFDGNISKISLPQTVAQSVLNFATPAISPALSRLSPPNSGLRWEQTSNFNLGLDYTLFKYINGSFDLYNKRSSDVLGSTQIDPTKGAGTGPTNSMAIVNQAAINNRGAELALHADWIHRQKFNWNTGFILSYNSSKVLNVFTPAVNSGVSSSQSILVNAATGYLQGYPIGEIFSYRYAGLNSSGLPLIYDKSGNAFQLSQTNDQGMAELVDEGSSIPKYSIGMSNRIDVGNFYIYAMLNYYGGFKVRAPYPNPTIARPIAGAQNAFINAGDEKNPDEVVGVFTYPSNALYPQYITPYLDKYTVNGAYMTLGDVTASYNIKNSPFVKKLGFNNFEIKLQAQNVYTIGFNKFNYSASTGSFAKNYVTPTYTIGLFTNF